jgi:hypothetical protein
MSQSPFGPVTGPIRPGFIRPLAAFGAIASKPALQFIPTAIGNRKCFANAAAQGLAAVELRPGYGSDDAMVS